MRITFKLQGVERVIGYDGKSYTAYKPETESVLGYYSTIGGAIERHVRDANLPEKNGQEEVIELRKFTERYKQLAEELRGMSQGDLFSSAVFEDENKTERAERLEKARANRGKNKIVESTESAEDEIQDVEFEDVDEDDI